MWGWESSRTLLVVAGAVTIVISLFEIRPSALAMLREVVSNFITSASITFVTATLVALFWSGHLLRDLKHLPAFLALLATGGVLGGLLAWGINDVLFPYQVTHPHVYLLTVATLAIIFGLAVFAYQAIAFKLQDAASRLAEKEIHEQQLQRLRTEAELDALRARVNPHFLFNTLNSIASLIPKSPERAEEMVQRLSNLFRYILSKSEHGLVRLGDELDVVAEYLEIEKVRLPGRLEYAIDRDPSVDDILVPGMLLQPLVENSVKYGIASKTNGGSVTVRCRRNGTHCVIAIEDTGSGFDLATADEGFGIGAVRQRLQLHYPDSHEFDIRSQNGVKIRIGIPLEP